MSFSILLVEDDTVLRGGLCELFEREGYAVEAAASAREARAKYGPAIDLIVLDVTLPVAEYAVQQGYDAIIAHHPILLTPLRNIRWDDPKGRILLTLARGDVAVFSGHTNYDHAALGKAHDSACCALPEDSSGIVTIYDLAVACSVQIAGNSPYL